MASKTHIHKYILRNIGSKNKPRKVYACGFSDCTHFMPSASLVIGKKSICWGCGDEFTIARHQIYQKRKKLKCNRCRDKFMKKGEDLKKAVSLDFAIDSLFQKMRED